jgi:hypothetical protein
MFVVDPAASGASGGLRHGAAGTGDSPLAFTGPDPRLEFQTTGERLERVLASELRKLREELAALRESLRAPARPESSQEGETSSGSEDWPSTLLAAEGRVLAESIARHTATLLYGIEADEECASRSPQVVPPGSIPVHEGDSEPDVPEGSNLDEMIVRLPRRPETALRDAERKRVLLEVLKSVRTLEDLARWEHENGIGRQ